MWLVGLEARDSARPLQMSLAAVALLGALSSVARDGPPASSDLRLNGTGDGASVAASGPGPAARPGGPEWGVASGTSYWLPAAAFAPRSTDSVFVDTGFGRFHLSHSGSGGYAQDLMAPVNLPQGAVLTELRMYWCDNDPVFDFQAWLLSYPEATFGDGTNIASLSTSGMPACASDVYAQPNVTIDNYNNQYNLIVRFGVGNGGAGQLDFKGARLIYNLQVSPPPATATFTDVPTGYWAFRHIEALYASGITAGCGTNPLIFCPEANITRAQMAVFLAKSLGLYWPD